MSFDHIQGQQVAIEALTRALRRGQVHHAYRFEGPSGVGKTMAALALAQALLCEQPEVVACGRCDACRRVTTFSEEPPLVPLHPDVVFVQRGLYPPAAIDGKKENTLISIEQIRSVVLARFGFPPHEGRARIFIVQQAELLSTHAANALLKSLEEPGDRTYFILLCARPQALLDTIRSRSLPVRFGPLSDDIVRAILRREGLNEEQVEAAVEVAEGSADVALAAASPETASHRAAFMQGVDAALASRRFDEAIRFAEGLDSNRARLVAHLGALGARYASDARRSVSAHPTRALRAARNHEIVLDAIAAVERNGSIKLMMSTLLGSLRVGAQVRPGPPAGPLPRRR